MTVFFFYLLCYLPSNLTDIQTVKPESKRDSKLKSFIAESQEEETSSHRISGSIKQYFSKALTLTPLPAVNKKSACVAKWHPERTMGETSELSLTSEPKQELSLVEEDRSSGLGPHWKIPSSFAGKMVNTVAEKSPPKQQLSTRKDQGCVTFSPVSENIIELPFSAIEIDAGNDSIYFTPELYDDVESAEKKNELLTPTESVLGTFFESANPVATEQPLEVSALQSEDAAIEMKADSGWPGRRPSDESEESAVRAAECGTSVGEVEQQDTIKKKKNKLSRSRNKGLSFFSEISGMSHT